MRLVSATALLCAALSVAPLGLRVDCPAFKVFLRASAASGKIGG